VEKKKSRPSELNAPGGKRQNLQNEISKLGLGWGVQKFLGGGGSGVWWGWWGWGVVGVFVFVCWCLKNGSWGDCFVKIFGSWRLRRMKRQKRGR